MTPAAFERAVDGGRAPTLALLARHGAYRRATSVFPSLTPVCLSSIVTGGGPDVHRIPHLVWWHRRERRIVEYGSSFAALRAAGMAQSLADTIYNMNQEHLGADAVTDYASHAHGPEGAEGVALARTDDAIEALVGAAGGADAFLERYAVIVLSDHGQTPVERAAQLELPLSDFVDDIVVTGSNRAGQVYLLPDARIDAAGLARQLDGEASVEVTLRREDDDAVARRAGEELRFRPGSDDWETTGDASLLDHPDAMHRAWSALANPNAGELLVSARPGWEFADLGGRHHAGGGSHGSLVEGDSVVPLLTIGVDASPGRITDVLPAVLSHFGVEAPACTQGLQRVR